MQGLVAILSWSKLYSFMCLYEAKNWYIIHKILNDWFYICNNEEIKEFVYSNTSDKSFYNLFG